MKNRQNIFVALLNLLNVKYTNDFSNRYFNEHPHKYNLFGLSKMLTDYGIENVGTRIVDKGKDIFEIETPFIAHFAGDFVVVHKFESDKVFFLWKGINHVLSVSEFSSAWSGIILLAESSDQSIEPDYKEHKKYERLNFLKRVTLIAVCCLALFLIYISRLLYTNIGISMLLLINIAGAYISYLLLLKQMHVQSQYADKICSLFKQSDCNHVLESKAAKLWGIFGWSEIGLGYFSTNVLLLLFLPNAVSILSILNILALPYSFWSVWYQKKKAKQWCVLCLIVQVLLWALFIANWLLGYIQMPAFVLQELFYLVIIGSCYLASVLIINSLIPIFNADRMVPILRQVINGMKADENVFKAILKQQFFYETKGFDSIIRFGNINSPLQLTIFSNPYCYPCSLMHKRIERLLTKMNNSLSVQYILSSFAENLNPTNKYLIAACLQNKDNVAQIFTDWFEKGKELGDDYFKNMNLDMENPEIEAEFQKYELWRRKTQLRATPIVLVNGYQLPENYTVDDLRYFTEFSIEM